ncbi:MAG: isochorismatase family protein [Bacteriovorax sp.]|nr:isochorismatase family protein [Bacteriovorax sp.]
MGHLKFSLSSDQLELLVAFANSEGLGKLAETMGKDPSVVSRSLQKIAEEFPVLVKVKGRWELTPLGHQTNELSKQFIQKQNALLPLKKNNEANENYIFDKSVLIVINAQEGLLDSTQEGRNNSDAEKNIYKILEFWRKNKKIILHVQHISENPASIFFRSSSGSNFLDSCTPQEGELVIEKSKSSAFLGTTLEAKLRELEPNNIILTGFTANECIDATAKDAASLGFATIVVGDATAMFDLRDTNGKLIKAERMHRLTLANINAYYAKVIQTAELLS